MDSRRRCLSLLLLALFAAFDLKLVSADAGIQIPHGQQVDCDVTDLDLANTNVLKDVKHMQSLVEGLEAKLKAKDSSLQDKEKVISFLKNQLEDVQGSGKVEERLLAAQDTANSLEAQVEKLHHDVGKLESELQTFKTRAESSEATVTELLNKNYEATKIDEEQQRRIHSTEEALRKAEAALQQSESELGKRTEDLVKVAEAWLPVWLVNLPDRFQELAIVEWGEHGEPIVAFLVREWGEHGEPAVAFLSKEWGEHGEPVVAFLSKEWSEHGEPVVAFISKEWREHGKPVVTFLSEKVYQISGAAQETVKEKWLPAAKQHWEDAVLVIGPHIEMVKVKVGEEWGEHGEPVVTFLSHKAYQISVSAQPHLETVKELVREKAGPYVDKTAVFAQPYVDKASVFAQPYVQSTRSFYGPFFEKAHSVYQILSKLTTTYHLRLQTSLQESIKKYECLAALASKELIWFLASALLLLPVLGIFLVFSSTFGGKTSNKSVRSSGGSHGGSSHKKKKSK
ncbi:hypothetical protein O6H91_22G011900 [Diphasiastrum complanatum]|uniref:Uncharacterized protein n=1 Tax=Diphasiastrum complanatum TaxID=34168 RepID=A0ACC2AD73_DIPCM|nr:hypothetical protein O6H91_22G011900 [Diphasiastrum complanatum]